MHVTQGIHTWILLFKETDRHKIHLEISRKIFSRHEARTLGITLGCHPDDVKYHVTNDDVRDAAYEFLCWTDEKYGSVEKWEKIIEALTTLGMNNTIIELGLQERLAATETGKLVQE